jgi:tetratricopeptide (TPR) repeat protein
MPEISLKAYFAKLNNLLGVSSADEVIQHSRHILQSYPKNVTAYRFLGRALVLSGRWEEGREALRRVLSVYPDDYIAHLGLSEANERLGHPDEAIWHLERAYEQNSNNRDVIEALRTLYRRYRNVENLKMQLTSAAVARQNLRSKNYAQAIDTLRSARARMNDRLDLKLLLAQVLWEHGSQEEAAEIAVEVLKVLPDCLEANRIMAQLWLEMGRPSDAQRYVNHLEAVDPYLAVEVAQGFAPDDDVFRLDELDYVRTSQSELASARPDWLTEIGSTPMPVLESADEPARDDWSSLLLGSKSPAPPVEPGPLTRFTEITPQPEPKRTGGLTDLFGEPDAPPAEELQSLFERATGNLDDELPSDDSLRPVTTRFAPEPENTGNLTDLFGEALAPHTNDLASLFEKNTGAFGSESGGTDDRMAWMRDAGIEMVDENDRQPSYKSLMQNDEDSELPVFDDSPMAWLEDHNSDLILESDTAEPGSASNDELLSWMQQEDDLAAAAAAPKFDAAPSAVPVENDDESLDWLQNDNLFGETPSAAGQLAEEFPASLEEDFASFSATGTDWQNDMLEQQQSATAANNVGSDAENSPSAPGARRGLTAILQEGNFDWVNQEKPEEVSADADMDDWLNQFGPAQPRTAPTDTPDWLSDLGISGSSGSGATSSEDDEWFEEDEPDRLSPAAMANANEFALLSQNDADEEEGDWLSALPPEEAAGGDADIGTDSEEEFEWVSGEAPAAAGADEAVVDTGALPNWLTDYVPAEGQSETAPPAAEISTMADASAPQPEADTALTDWLSELESEDEPETAAETPTSEGEVSWTEETGLEAEEAATEETDWLAELQPAVEGATSGGDMSWLSELGSASSDAAAAETENAAEPVASEDMDWLSELEPASSETTYAEPEVVADPVAGGDMDWLSELEPASSDTNEAAEEVAADAQAEPIAEDMSWLTNLGVDAETLVADVPVEPVATDDADWLSELETVSSDAAEPEVAAQPVASEDMSWLSELEPAVSAEPEMATSEASAVSNEDFPWMAEDADTEQPAAEADAEPIAEADMDWLAELEPEAEQPPAIKLEPAASSDLEWLAELDAATEKPAVNVEDFPWMADEAEAAVADAQAEQPAEADMDWLAELQPDADTGVAEQPVATAVSDEDMSWLSELEPTPEPEK